jgi:hypothetical protein
LKEETFLQIYLISTRQLQDKTQEKRHKKAALEAAFCICGYIRFGGASGE